MPIAGGDQTGAGRVNLEDALQHRQRTRTGMGGGRNWSEMDQKEDTERKQEKSIMEARPVPAAPEQTRAAAAAVPDWEDAALSGQDD